LNFRLFFNAFSGFLEDANEQDKTMIRTTITAVFAGLFGLLATTAQAELLGDAKRGEQLFRDCSACHQVGPEARNRVGPHLNNIFGRKAGGVGGDFRYSKGLTRMGADGLVWGYDTLHAYIDNPKALVSDTRMAYRGMKDETDRADLLAYLREYSASPANIPESAPTARATEVVLSPEILAIAGDTAYGEYLSSECLTCHLRSGSNDGIPGIIGWPVEDFVIAMHAYKQQIRPHPVMQMMAGRLSNEEIAALAAYFEGLE
jgi:cytochrome c